MLLQRVLSLALVLVGVAVGWGLRPLAEVPEVEAAGSRGFRCLFPGSSIGSMVFHNPTARDAEVILTNVNDGSANEFESETVFARDTRILGIDQAGGVIIRSSGPLLVDAYTGSGDAVRQVACYREK